VQASASYVIVAHKGSLLP